MFVRRVSHASAGAWLLCAVAVGQGQSVPAYRTAMEQAEEAVANDDYAGAVRVLTAARRGAPKAINQELNARIRDVAELGRAFDKIRPLVDMLSQARKDGRANAEVGKFYCLVKGDWTKGLAMLAQGDDAALRSAAELEAQDPKDAPDQLRLGEAWWQAAQDLKGPQRTQGFLRARHWYLRARPKLDAEGRKTVQRRLEAIPLMADRIVIWNTHNRGWKDRGALECRITLLLQEKPVWQATTPIEWNENGPSSVVVRPPRKGLDAIQVDVTKYRGKGAGLAEIEVYQGPMNLALYCPVRASTYFEQQPLHHPRQVTDGQKNSDTTDWCVDNWKTGWAKVFLLEYLDDQP